MGALAKLRVTTGEGNQIVAVGEVIAPSGGSGRKDKGIQALVGIDVALPHEGGLRDVPAIAASGGIGGAVIFEMAGGEGRGGWLKVDQGSAGGRRGRAGGRKGRRDGLGTAEGHHTTAGAAAGATPPTKGGSTGGGRGQGHGGVGGEIGGTGAAGTGEARGGTGYGAVPRAGDREGSGRRLGRGKPQIIEHSDAAAVADRHG